MSLLAASPHRGLSPLTDHQKVTTENTVVHDILGKWLVLFNPFFLLAGIVWILFTVPEFLKSRSFILEA
jgi:hypothetical protein